MKNYKMHVISNTHWDREWRHSFQRMRIDLVEMMDRLLDICENDPDFKHYHLDSQTILLEDYLEVRPEKKEVLSKHIKSGKILVGPWYTLPDMYLVSAEAITRNLMRGHKIAGGLGRVMKVGYTPTSYGQISQMPQVYTGFGIDSILFYRGLDFHGIKNSEYIFEGADGTRLLGIKFSEMTRFNFRFNVFGGTIHNDKDKMILFHPCDPDSYRSTYTWIHSTFLDTYRTDDILEGIEKTKADLVQRSTTEHLLMMDGFDASYPHSNTGRIVKDSKNKLSGDEIIHAAFPDFIKAVRESVDPKKLKVIKGESRVPAVDTFGTSTMPGVLTSHIYLKLANHETQTLLEKYAEPVSVFSWLLGNEYPDTFIELAWKYLLSNHGHDTICGASVDQIYVDAMSRIDQARMIARGITHQSEFNILGKVTKRDNDGRDQVLTVFNPLPYSRTETTECMIEFPQDDKAAGFVLEDFKGNSVPFDIVSKEKLYGVSESGEALYNAYFVDRYKVNFLADDIPALGYKCFRLKAVAKNEKNKAANISAKSGTMENDFVKVTINMNGTVNIIDKENNRTYKNMNYFEDGGDGGNPWHFKRPKVKDNIVNSLKAKAVISMVHNSPMSCTYKVALSFNVPAALNKEKTHRLKKTKPVSVVSLYSLSDTSRYLSVKTTVNSPIMDHRLRVMFPTGVKTDKCYSEGNFDLMVRDIKHPKDAPKWIDCEVGIQPQQSFVGLSDGKAGLAVLNRGLREYEVLDNKARTIALTILRGYRYIKIAGGAQPIAEDLDQVRCQCMGEFEYDYAIFPHMGNWEKGKVYEEARRFNVPLRMSQCSAGTEMIKPELSFVRIKPEHLILSAMKRSESGKSLILRLYNPTGRALSGSIVFANELRKARLVNLNEEPIEDIALRESHKLNLKVARKKLVTLEVFLKTLKIKK